MRIFAAIPLPSNIKTIIGQKQDELKRIYRGLKYVKPENMHLTIYFFGELDGDRTGEIIQLMDDKSLKNDVIACSIGGAGFFPSKGMVRVIYIDIGRGAEEIIDYQNRFVGLLEEHGFSKPERGFKCHITLARNKSERVDRELMGRKLSFRTPLLLDRFVLYQSILRKEGPVYKPIKTIMFENQS